MENRHLANRKKTFVRMLSLVLCLVMILGTLPVQAGAAAGYVTLKFSAMGGSGAPVDQTKALPSPAGATFTIPQQKPAKQGYTFVAWRTSSGATYTLGDTITLVQDTTLYAIWTQASTLITTNRTYYYTITYYGQGADVCPPVQYVTSQTAETTASVSKQAMTKPGYTFLGWGTSVNGPVLYSPGQKITMTHSLYLYALWQKNDDVSTGSHIIYRLSYNANGGEGAPATQNVDGSYPVCYATLSYNTPTRDLYRFKGWGVMPYGEAVYQPGQRISITADTMLFAIWERGVTSSYTITYASNSSTVYGLPMPQTISGTTSALTFQLTTVVPQRAGYSFMGWSQSPISTAPTFASGQTVTVNQSMTLYPVWTKSLTDRYALTFHSNGGSGAPGAQSAIADSTGRVTIPLAQPTRPGYVFLGWSESAYNQEILYKPGTVLQLTYHKTLYAAWRPETTASYTVVYDANGGSGAPYMSTADSSGRVTLSGASPLKAGCIFKGWATERTGYVRYQPGESIWIANNIALYAVWEASAETGRYMIAYNGNGGINTPSAHYSDYGTAVISTKTPTRAGYMFLGWSTYASATSSTYAPGQQIMVTGNMTFYAVWASPNCSLIYDANGGTGGPGVQTVTTNSGWATVALLTQQPQRTGYTFAGWSLNEDGSGYTYLPGASITIRPNTRIYAVWIPNTQTGSGTGSGSTSSGGIYSYTINYNLQGGYSGPSKQVFSGNSRVVQAQLSGVKPMKDGQVFLGWSLMPQGDVTYQPGQNYALSQNLTLFAIWQTPAHQQQFQVTFDDNGGTGGPGVRWAEGEPGAVSMVIPSVQPKRTGYGFVGWSEYPNSLNAQYRIGSRVAVQNTMTLYAVWTSTSVTYTVSYSANQGTGAPAMQYAEGSMGSASIQLSYQTPTRNGYDFKGWSEDPYAYQASWQPGQYINLTRSTVLYAIWEKAVASYPIYYHPNGGSGGPAGGTAYGTYDMATAVILSTKPTRNGYIFKGWSTSPLGDGVIYVSGMSITVSGPTTLYAVWQTEAEKMDVILSFDANGGSGAPSPVHMIVDAGKSAVITIPRSEPHKEKYRFCGWSTSPGGNGELRQPGDTVALSIPATMYAVWELEDTKTAVYTIYFWDNGGTGGPGLRTIETIPNYTAPFTVPDNRPVRPGYRFMGWSEDPEGRTGVYQPGVLVGIKNSTEFFAVWKPEDEPSTQFTITYFANGGVSAPDAQVWAGAPDGLEVRLTSDTPVRSGYLFKGWCKDRAGVTEIYAPYALFTLRQDTMLYAIWEKAGSTVQYTITYDSNNGTGIFYTQNASGTPGNVVAACCSDKPVMAGNTFLGWSFYPTGDGNLFHAGQAIPVPGNLTLYGVWAQGTDVTQLRFYFDAQGGTGGPGPIEAEGFGNQQYIQIQMPSQYPIKNGYVFLGWADSKTPPYTSYRPGETAFFPMAETYNKNNGLVTLYAVWQESILSSHYTITYNAGGGTGGPLSDTAIGTTGNTAYTIPLLQPERPGWSFSGWATTPNATRPLYQPGQQISVAGDLTLYAVWGTTKPQATYTLTFSGNGGDNVPSPIFTSGDSDSVVVTVPQQLPSRDGATFAGWATDPATPVSQSEKLFQPGQQLVLQCDVTLYAIWNVPVINSYTVTLDWNNGTDHYENKVVQGPEDVLVLQCPASPTWGGHTFCGWARSSSGVVEYTPSDDIPVSGSMTLYAIWDKQGSPTSFLMVYDSMGGVWSNGQTSYSEYAWGYDGSVAVTLTSSVPVRTGYTFKGWSNSANPTAIYQPGETIMMNGASRFFAVWEGQQAATMYYIYYDMFGGAGGPANTSVRSAGSFMFRISDVTPTKQGYTFLGWQTGDSSTIYQPGEEVLLTSNAIFTACWA